MQMITVPTTRHSLYWDDFEKRINETVAALKAGTKPPVRRVAVFITDRCNFRCGYCNHRDNGRVLSEDIFRDVVSKYGDTAIIHITGGEPSTVPWLYRYLRENGDRYRFHLNTNAFITPPYTSVKRLKVSLDSTNAEHWDSVVGVPGAFKRVVANIKKAIPHTVVSVTYTLSRDNYRGAIDFARFAREEFDGLYAIFFSVYKGTNPKFAITDHVANDFFNNILPVLEGELSEESLGLIHETIDEKRRLVQGIRFEQNLQLPCYLSMSERVIAPDGTESTCSHLYRDGIFHSEPVKHWKCQYGCNRRLVMFNEEVQRKMEGNYEQP